jgi:hypothetical protein
MYTYCIVHVLYIYNTNTVHAQCVYAASCLASLFYVQVGRKATVVAKITMYCLIAFIDKNQ